MAATSSTARLFASPGELQTHRTGSLTSFKEKAIVSCMRLFSSLATPSGSARDIDFHIDPLPDTAPGRTVVTGGSKLAEKDYFGGPLDFHIDPLPDTTPGRTVVTSGSGAPIGSLTSGPTSSPGSGATSFSAPTPTPLAEDAPIDWSRRDDIAARLEGDLRAMPRAIIEHVHNVEKILGQFPTIVLVDDPNVPGGLYDPNNKQIKINKNLPYNRQLALLIFELLNAEKHFEFLVIHDEATTGMHTKESFAAAYERVEYENTKVHHRIVQGLARELDIYRRGWSSFDHYLRHQIATGHTRGYYQGFERLGLRYFFGPPTAPTTATV